MADDTDSGGAHGRRIEESEEDQLILAVEHVICGYVRTETDDMSMRQVAALVRLARGPLEMTPLSRALGLSLSSVSRSVDALVKLRYVRRTRRGRHVTASLTPAGRAKIGRIMLSARPRADAPAVPPAPSIADASAPTDAAAGTAVATVDAE